MGTDSARGTTGPSAQYDPATREMAYQLWLFRCRRNCSAVARALEEDHPDLSDRTIRTWRNDDGWDARSLRELGSVSRATNLDDAVGVLAGASESIDALREIVNNPKAGPTARVGAANTLLQLRGYVRPNNATDATPDPLDLARLLPNADPSHGVPATATAADLLDAQRALTAPTDA